MSTPVVAREASRGWPVEFDGLLSTLPVPLLVTHGADDPLVPERIARELASSVPTGALSRIGGAHLPFMLDADRFNQDLVTLLTDAENSRNKK